MAASRITTLEAREPGTDDVVGELVLHSHRGGDRTPEPVSGEGLLSAILGAGSFAHSALSWPIGATLSVTGHADADCAIFIKADLSEARVVFPDGSGIVCTLG